MKKFASKLANSEFTLCRKFEAAGIVSLSQAVKAFERGENDKIEEWKKLLAQQK